MRLERITNQIVGKMEQYTVVPCKLTELGATNKAYLNPGDAFAQFEHIAIRYPKQNEAFVFSVATDLSVERKQISFNSCGRKWAGLQTNTVIEAAPYKFIPQSQCLRTITFYVDFFNRSTAPTGLDFNTDEMAKQFLELFTNQALTVGQLFAFVFRFNNTKVIFELKVKEMEAVNIEQNQTDVGVANVEIGLTTPNTIIMFESAEGISLRLTGSLTGIVAAPNLFNQDWDFSTMGVGGLGEQFNLMFRRAFASRLLPPKFAEDIGEEHVRGILLYGPPGTGKTLIARQIGQMLLTREPKIVSGPEVLNKYVGESEANIRKLFADAEEEQAKMGRNSALHVIIFDEIDALCKARGNSASSSGVGDNVVNQLLSKIDGVKALNNVLLIGMTNRRDLIDEALLRPGRLELQIEIGLPDKQGRLEIFNIHTKLMREQNVLDASVNLEELAERTRNYTGAEIAGLTRAARSLAVNRVVKAGKKIEITEEMLKSIKVTRDDFLYAMTHDAKPAHGVSEDQLKDLAKPMIQWDPAIRKVRSELADIVKKVSNLEGGNKRPRYVLLVGEPGAGLTTISANMAVMTKFPLIRLYQLKSVAGETDHVKVMYMQKLFEDAIRSQMSCIIMDNLRIILDYCHIGPRFSTSLKNVFEANWYTPIPNGRRMLVICTCNYEPFINDLMLTEIFDDIIKIPSLIKPEQIRTVLDQTQEGGDSTFSVEQTSELIDSLGSIPFKMGIKKLERLIDDASLDPPKDRVKLFLERMNRLQLVVRQSRLDQPFEF